MKKSVYQYSLRRKKVMEFCENGTLGMPEEAVRFLRNMRLEEEEQERLIALVLNSKNSIKACYTVTVGLIDSSPAHPREVFRNAIISGASSLILAHNHPSGSSEPSAGDVRVTGELVRAGKIIGIEIVDHIIIGDGFFSFRAAGKMEGMNSVSRL